MPKTILCIVLIAACALGGCATSTPVAQISAVASATPWYAGTLGIAD